MHAVVKGEKAGSGKARKPVIAPDSAQSRTFIKVLHGLSWGEIESVNEGLIYAEDTPLKDSNGAWNFQNISVETRNGTNDQEYIKGFPDITSESQINVELKNSTPWVKSITNLDLDSVSIRMRFDALREQKDNGDVTGTTVEYAIDLQTDGGTWTEVIKAKVSDKTSPNYERQHRIELPKADHGWQIRARRLTPDSTSDLISNKMYVRAMVESIDAKLAYPNIALLYLQYDAGTFGGNVAKISARAKGIRIPVATNYDPETGKYTGMWDGLYKEAYTTNPAWHFLNICLNKDYGLGNRIDAAMIDKWSVYQLAQYCDERVPDGKGGFEPRFTLNVYLQAQEDAWSILQKIAASFRAFIFWDGQKIQLGADVPQDSVYTYTSANIIGLPEYSGTAAEDRHNVFVVKWDNPNNRFKTESLIVRDEQSIATQGIKKLEIEAWGVTSEGQAQRAGQWALKSEKYETRTVTFKVGLDALVRDESYLPQVGRVIELADPLFAGRENGGRITAVSKDLLSITLDRDDVVCRAGDRLVVNGDNGRAQARVVSEIQGRVVTVVAPFDSVSAQHVWAIDAQDLATMKFRVISITQDEQHEFTITGLQYNPAKYEAIDSGAFIDERPISIINPTLQAPVKSVTITSEAMLQQGIHIESLVISWEQASGATQYQVEWRKDNGVWIKLPVTGGNLAEVPGIYAGKYEARVTAISAFNIASLPTYSAVTELKGKQGKPPKLAFIKATGVLFGMKLDWGYPANALDTAYVEIQVSPDGKANIAQLGLFSYPTTTHTIQGLQPNLTQFYRGRLIDRIGNVGGWSDWTSGTTTVNAEDVLDLLKDQISESQLQKDLTTKIEIGVAAGETAQQASEAAAHAIQTAEQARNTASSANAAAAKALEDAAVASRKTDELAASTQSKYDKLVEDTNTKTQALENGITQERTDRIAADSKISGDFIAYKQSNDSAVASATTKADAAVNLSEANAQQIVTTNAELKTKNRTYYQNTAPTANLITGDLWYNTADQNKVKRWNGTAWVDVSDLRTDLNSNAITAIKADVKKVDDKATSNASRLDGVDSTLTSLRKDVDSKATSSAVTEIKTQTDKNAADIKTNSTAITTLQGDVKVVKDGLTSKADNSVVAAQQQQITSIDGRLSTATQDIVTIKSNITKINNDVAEKANIQTVNQLAGRVTETEKGIETQSDRILSLDNRINLTVNRISIDGSNDIAKDIIQDAVYSKGEVTYVTDNAATAGRYLQMGNNSGVDVVWLCSTQFMPIDPNRMYRLKARYKVTERTSSMTQIYLGIACKNADKSKFIDTGNNEANSMGSSTYLLSGQNPTVGVWLTYEGFISGKSLAAAGGSGTLASPKTVPNKAAYMSPMLVANYNLNTGTTIFDYLILEVADDISAINASTTAVNSIQGKVTNIEGNINAISNDVSSLKNRVSIVEGKVETKADANALQAIDARVSKTESGLVSQSSSITKLENSMDIVTNASQNLLIKSNKVGEYNGNYPHIQYSLGEAWEVDQVYTLFWCAEHKRSSTDTNTSLAFYAGGGTQFVQQFPVNGGKQIIKTTFTKTSAGLSQVAQFYLLNRSANSANTVATVYWAVLLKGDIGSVNAWFPSAYDYTSDINAINAAQSSMDSKITAIDGRVVFNTNTITSLNSRVNTVENNLTRKLDASVISGYYTKAETDAKSQEIAHSVTAGKIEEYNTNLRGAGGNTLLKSNVVKSKPTGSNPYPFASYSKSTAMVVGKKYTLVYEASFSKVGGASFTPYGTANQQLEKITTSFSRQVRKVTFTATSAHSVINFYLVSTDGTEADRNASVATVYWATLYEGDVVIPDVWQASDDDTQVFNLFSTGYGDSVSAHGIRNADESAYVWIGGRGIGLHQFDQDGLWVKSTNFDTYGAAANNDVLADAIIALPKGTIVAITSYDAIAAPSQKLRDAFASFGVSATSIPTSGGRHVILYVGIKGNAVGSAVEMFSPAVAPVTPPLFYTLVLTRGKANSLSGAGGTSNAIKQIETSVTEVDKKLVAMGTDYSNLKSAVDNNKAEAERLYQTKADASASSATLRQSITSEYKQEILNTVRIKDTRSVNQPPSHYYQNFPSMTVEEFKTASVIGLSGMGIYVTLKTTVRWTDSSGGAIVQEARADDSRLTKYRKSVSVSAWSEWVDDYKYLTDAIGKKLDASVINNYSTTTEMNRAIGVAKSEVSAELDALQVGGSNLLNNPSFEKDMSGWSRNVGGVATQYRDTTCPSGTYDVLKLDLPAAGNGWYQGFGLASANNVGETFTTSVWLKGAAGGEKVILMGEVHTGHHPTNPITLTTSWKRYVITAKRSNTAGSLTFYSSDSKAITIYASRIQYERGSFATDWKTPNAEILNNLNANAVANTQTLAEVKVVDGKVNSLGTNLSQVSTTVNGHTASIQSQQSSINGIYAQSFLKLDVNGHVAGHGSMNDGKTATMIFNYDAIQFGAPNGVTGIPNKPLMVLQNSPVTLPNGTVIPRGLYVDNGYFGSIDANKINAESLSAISANLGTFTTSNSSGSTTISGSYIEVKDSAGRVRVKIGVW
ncbi:TipJ family phage tail tip protein [Acinetobacter stercoris]|uniref:Phage tail protein n=1 Tax=Acinetobacter stercoris TaxID=2126983 RepID=A0A2U3MUU7_9GAMM|nr:phage tail protein [Acinetobacter stercoris]SPL69135.1 hypothetical protein KPC_0313 [Acinetobacter stercoris]